MIRFQKRYCLLLICFLVIIGCLLFINFHSEEVKGRKYDKKEKEYHFGIVIDAGSSGTRVYIYTWGHHSGDPAQLLDIKAARSDATGKPLVKKIEPGLSTLASRPKEATTYLRPLLDYAAKHVPSDKHQETPLYVLGTAGLRLLSDKEREPILENIREEVGHYYKFLFIDTHVEMISGKQEGIYQWMATNFVLGRFDHRLGNGTIFRRPTVAIIDMGGASVQVAMEVDEKVQLSGAEGASFNLGCQEHEEHHSYRLFVSTWLGMGSNEARKKWETFLLENYFAKRYSSVAENTKDNAESITTEKILVNSSISHQVEDPCLPLNRESKVRFTSSTTGDVTVLLVGTGRYEKCREDLIATILKGASKKLSCLPCMSSGEAGLEVFGFSEFWYSVDDILRLGHQLDPYHSDMLDMAAADHCSTDWHQTLRMYRRGFYPRADFNRLLHQCFKSSWISAVLHEGFHISRNFTKFRPTSLVDGEAVQWTLGALLYRTRFLPLRALGGVSDAAGHVVHSASAARVEAPSYKLYLVYLLLCIAVVLTAILLYMRRLGAYVAPQLRGLRSIRSLASMTSMANIKLLKRPQTFASLNPPSRHDEYATVRSHETRSYHDPGLLMA